jgi:hypothetical protein
VEVDGEPISELHVDPQALSDAIAAGTGTVRAMTSEATREPR